MASLNAGPEYYAAEERYRNARNAEDKLASLKDMLRLCPKHKASESMLLEIKGKIAALRKEMVKEARVRSAKKSSRPSVKRQGSAQVALVGLVNCGKSALLNALTNAKTPSSDIPFETRVVLPAMMEVGGVQVQLLDTPSLTTSNKPMVFSFCRNADLAVIILDPMHDLQEQLSFFEGEGFRKMLVVSRKLQVPGAARGQFFYYDAFDKADVRTLGNSIFSALGLMRVFTRNPKTGETDRARPIALPAGSDVSVLAKEIHKDLFRSLKYARVWGAAKFPGQQVGADFVLHEGDVVELHLK